MKIEVWGRCSGESLAQLQEDLYALVEDLVAGFPAEGTAYLVCSGFIGPPFVHGTRFTFWSSMAPHPIVFVTALEDQSMGVQYSLIVPEGIDSWDAFVHVRDRATRLVHVVETRYGSSRLR